MKKVFSFFFACIFFVLFFPTASVAADNFNSSYEINYTTNEKGLTTVVFNISLTNKTEQNVASAYKLLVGFNHIDHVAATDPGGAIQPKITHDDDGYTIDIGFNKPAVGQGNTFTFVISFDTPDVAKKYGSIWEINIPGISNQDDFSEFNAHVKVPQSFGTPAYIKPNKSYSTDLTFSKEQLGKSGISLAFGTEQIYGFTLSYHLRNKNLFPVSTEIAIPPSTNYQEVAIEGISPLPTNVTKDQDGNWLAHYTLSPSESKTITVAGKARIFLIPKKQPLTDTEKTKYLAQRPFWQQDAQIKQLARDLGTAEAIYEYVVKHLTYDFSRVTSDKPRLGASGVLNNPKSAVCLEFTDLFVALARSAGIPAREVDGFANTENDKERPLSLVKDVLHAWPEYYDEERQTWIMVDPTWGNTTGGLDYFNTLDFDHFAFVIKGLNSSYPVPAGGYKLGGMEDTKDVHVATTAEFGPYDQKTKMTHSTPKRSLSGLPIVGSVTLTNNGSLETVSENVEIFSSFLTPQQQTVSFSKIPPFGHQTNEFTFDRTPFLTNKVTTVTMQSGEKTASDSIAIAPIFLSQTILFGGFSIVLLTIILSFVAQRAWRVYVSRQGR